MNHEVLYPSGKIKTLYGEKREVLVNEIIEIYTEYLYLLDKGQKHPKCTPIEDGNMNLVLKVFHHGKYYVVKHSPPWVYKYPGISAPQNRSFHEAQFYQRFVNQTELKDQMPEFIGYHSEHHVVILAYIENSYNGSVFYYHPSIVGIPSDLIRQIIKYFAELHQIKIDMSESWENKDLKLLNYQHIFVLPYQLDQIQTLEKFCLGLSDIGRRVSHNKDLIDVVSQLGAAYLKAPPEVLLHGDLYPGSLVISKNKVYVIDPEFSFYGQKEYDLSIFFAHHLILGGSLDDIYAFIDLYLNYSNENDKDLHASFKVELCLGFIGCEILRRLLGAARLPFNWKIEKYREMINQGIRLCFQYRGIHDEKNYI